MGVVLLSPLPRYCRLTTARNEYDANTDRFLAIGRFTENGAEPYQRGVAGSPSCSMTASGTLRASCQPRDPRVGDELPVDVVVRNRNAPPPTMVGIFRFFEGDVHVFAVCQPSVPALAAICSHGAVSPTSATASSVIIGVS